MGYSILNRGLKLFLGSLGVPSVPTNFKSISSDTKVTLSWNTIPYATGYRLERSLSPYFISPTLIYSGKSNLVEDDDVVPGTKYYYRVAALSRNNLPKWVKIEATLLTPFEAPDNFEVSDLNIHELTVVWDMVGNADNYVLTISTSSTFASGNTTVTVDGNINEYTFDELDEGTHYYMRITASASGRESVTYATCDGTTLLS